MFWRSQLNVPRGSARAMVTMAQRKRWRRRQRRRRRKGHGIVYRKHKNMGAQYPGTAVYTVLLTYPATRPTVPGIPTLGTRVTFPHLTPIKNWCKVQKEERPPARASHKMRRPASRENGPHDFFLFWRTLAEQLSRDRARSWDGAHRTIFSLRPRTCGRGYFDVLQ